jgi:uncharacterized protein (DUF2236 family)
MIKQKVAIKIRALLSGSPDGVPQWTPEIESGDDVGLFKPTDAAWIVHADVATMIGGIRALLMQALHPGSLAGVMQHSRYEEDALGRLSGTIRWLTICSFGSTQALEHESARVRQMHEKVKGNFTTNDNQKRDYKASDPDLLLWVHVAFTDSFLASHQVFGQRPINADEYVKQWGEVVIPLGVQTTPQSQSELKETLKNYDNQLRVDDKTKRVINFIQNPPFTGPTKLVYKILFAAAYNLLEPQHQKAIGLKAVDKRIAIPAAKFMMNTLRFILGTNSPLETAALNRHLRLGHGKMGS